MSRKQIFAKLTPPTAEIAQDAVGPDPNEGQAPRRPSRIRPLLGSPDLVDDGGRSPVGALGQSLGEQRSLSPAGLGQRRIGQPLPAACLVPRTLGVADEKPVGRHFYV